MPQLQQVISRREITCTILPLGSPQKEHGNSRALCVEIRRDRTHARCEECDGRYVLRYFRRNVRRKQSLTATAAGYFPQGNYLNDSPARVTTKRARQQPYAFFKVWVKPFQRLAVSKGRAFGRRPQRAAGSACTHTSRFIHRRVKTSPGAEADRKSGRNSP